MTYRSAGDPRATQLAGWADRENWQFAPGARAPSAAGGVDWLDFALITIFLIGLYTNFTIIAGFSILVLSNFVPTVYFGLLTSLAMILALAGSLTLLPQLLIVFKPLGPESHMRSGSVI